MRRALGVVAVLAALATALPAGAVATGPTVEAPVSEADGAANPWLNMRVMNMAHRGGEAEAPSNTMYAFKRAVDLGADMIELDVHSTADGRLAVIHDATVDRTTEGTGRVRDLTLEQMQALDAAYDFDPDHGYPLRGVRTGDTS